MRKQEFLRALKRKLARLPRQELEERLNFYSEMIDDRIEEDRTEEEAVSDIGTVDEITAQILADKATEREKPKRRLGILEILLLALGSPIWLSLVIAAFSVIFSIYAVLWSIVVSVWSVFASLAACAISGVVAGIIFSFIGNGLSGIVTATAGIVCAGLTVFLFFGCKAATKGIIVLTQKSAAGIKGYFVKKENT
ncbi:MAG: DUF1700 domain-containing protein [Clostridia bacterium]|nr:DUF1700 domain-containing protein [Clostridia bacterium]